VKTNTFLDKYIDILSKLKLKDINNKNKVFEDLQEYTNMFFNIDKNIDKNINLSNININIDSNYINSSDINQLDDTSSIILNYLITELEKLLNYSSNTQDKFLKVKTAYFILDVIINSYSSFNQENIANNIEINRFKYIINSDSYIYGDKGKPTVDEQTSGYYGEYTDPFDKEKEEKEETDEVKEEKQDLIEENDAVDVDPPLDGDFYENDQDQE